MTINKKNPKDAKAVTPAIDGLAVLTAKYGAEKVEGWRKLYAPRKLSVLVVEDKMAVLRPVGATEVGNFSMMMADDESGLSKATEYLINELWIDGDMEILNNEEYFISAMLQAQRIIEVKKSSFFKL